MVTSAEASGIRPLTRTRTSEYYVREDGVVVQSIVTPGKMSLDDARANIALFEQLAEGEPRLVLVEMLATYTTEPGVREYYASEAASRLVRAVAMVTPSAAGRIVGNFFLRMNQPGYPCKMFNDIDAAVAWLHEHERG